MKNALTGMTLIDSMAVAGAIGLVGMVAIPAWHGYSARSSMSEDAAVCRTAPAEYAAVRRDSPTATASGCTTQRVRLVASLWVPSGDAPAH